jgi:hypothetical protein
MAVTCMSSETSSGTKGANAAPSGSCGQKGKGRSESKSTSRSYARLLLLLLVGHWLLAASCDREGTTWREWAWEWYERCWWSLLPVSSPLHGPLLPSDGPALSWCVCGCVKVSSCSTSPSSVWVDLPFLAPGEGEAFQPPRYLAETTRYHDYACRLPSYASRYPPPLPLESITR